MSLFERLIHCLQEGYDIKLLKHAGEGELISLLIAMVEEMRMNGE